MFECKICHYSTERSSDLERHKKTKKHLFNKQNTDIFICDLCRKSFSTKTNMNKHKKHNCMYTKKKIDSNSLSQNNQFNKHIDISISKELDEKEKELQIMKEKLKGIDEKNKQLEEKLKGIDELKEQNKVLIDLAMQNSKNVGTSVKNVRSMTRIIKHFNNNPPIKLLEGSGAVKLLTYDNKKTENDAIDIIINKHKNKILIEYLGDIIIGAYKKDDPKLQSIWGIDTSRLNFALKQTEWTSDKKGINFTKLIISPLLKKVEEMIHEYTGNKIKGDNISAINDLGTNILSCEEIKVAISKKILHKKILQYITPHFEFTQHIINSISIKKNDSDSSGDKPKKIVHSNKSKKKTLVVASDSDTD